MSAGYETGDMVTFRYDAGEEEPAEVTPVGNEFEYVSGGDYWAVKVGENERGDLVKWIPNRRVYEIRGQSSSIRPRRP